MIFVYCDELKSCRRHDTLVTPHQRSAVWGSESSQFFGVSKTRYSRNWIVACLWHAALGEPIFPTLRFAGVGLIR